MRSSVAPHNSDPTWRKEELIFEYPKGSTEEGAPIFVFLEVLDTTSSMASSLKLRSKGSASLGLGSVDVTPLIKGEDGHAVSKVESSGLGS